MSVSKQIFWLAASVWLAGQGGGFAGSSDTPSGAGAAPAPLTRVVASEVSSPPRRPGGDLFDDGPIPRLRLQIGPGEIRRLEQNRRTYVPAQLSEGTNHYPVVEVHLKGARGSVRPLSDKPSFTLDFTRPNPAQRFHGLRKIHLNNSVEDPTYLCEKLGAELFHRASQPAPRVSHVLVELNGRALGLFVLKEGFTGDLFGLYFQRSDGNLYEPESGQDVADPMKRHWGQEPDKLAGLKSLGEAVQEPDLARRWTRLQETLETDRFASFMCLEVMLGHRDGYCLAKNNFRVYHDLDQNRMVFLPQGMDVLFGKADLPWNPALAGLTARAWMEIPDGQLLYETRFENLFTNLFLPKPLGQWLDHEAARLRPALRRAAAQEFDGAVADLKKRIVARHANLARQLSAPERFPLSFTNGLARLGPWFKMDEPQGGVMDQVKVERRTTLHIRAGPKTGASWRCKVRLQPGRYRFEGMIRTLGVEPLPFGRVQGACLRVLGQTNQPQPLVGIPEWQRREATLEIRQSTQEVELLCELRARSGEAWFDSDSLCLRLAEGPK